MAYRYGSHSVYDLKYHIVFCTKYRYRILTGEVAIRVRSLIRAICKANDVDIVNGSMSPEHVHLLLSVPPQLSVSKIVQYIKGKSSRIVLEEFSHIPTRYGSGSQHLWTRGYFGVTVGNVTAEEIQRYIEQQDKRQPTG
jgi:putative transposase